MANNPRKVSAAGALGPFVLTACLAFGTPPPSAGAPASTPVPVPHDRLVAEYLDGRWAELEADLGPATKPPPAPATGPAAAAGADVDAIRRALGECRPAWWKQVAQGKKVGFRPAVWGRTLAATFDPAAKTGININFVGSQPAVTLKWDASEMDSAAPAEHGFTKGELSDLGIWMNLGMAESWSAIPFQSQLNLNEQGRLQLTRYLEFRGNVTGAYYGSPRARRWALWLGLASWSGEHAKSPSVMSRRALGAMFVAEVAGHPARYPSIRLPEPLPADGPEAKLAEHLRGWVEKHGLTLAEDQALREALKAFAAANGGAVRQSGKVTLGNGTEVSLDLESDKAFSTKREEWFRVRFKGAPR